MKNTLKVALGALAVLSLSTLTFATPDTAATGTAPTAAAAKTETLTGKVTTVNADKSSFKMTVTSKGTDGKEASKEVELWWTDKTTLSWKNEAKTAATKTDLKSGAEVTVKAEQNKDGNWVATELWFHPAATTEHKGMGH